MMTIALLPLAAAGTQDAPELTDDAGDANGCFGPVGNEYADIVAAWVSDETADAFTVNIALAKWTNENIATASGYTIQFTHQEKQFGVAAAYIPPPLGDGWEFDNGYIDLQTQELKDFEDAEGSFTPGTPAIISVVFDKGNFPHGQAMDHTLHTFVGGSADFKSGAPAIVTGDDLEFMVCDRVESAATYTFQTGAHSMGAMGGNETSGGDMSGMDHSAMDDGTDEAVTLQPQSSDGGNETPGAGVAFVALAVVAVALAARRRS